MSSNCIMICFQNYSTYFKLEHLEFFYDYMNEMDGRIDLQAKMRVFKDKFLSIRPLYTKRDTDVNILK